MLIVDVSMWVLQPNSAVLCPAEIFGMCAGGSFEPVEAQEVHRHVTASSDIGMDTGPHKVRSQKQCHRLHISTCLQWLCLLCTSYLTLHYVWFYLPDWLIIMHATMFSFNFKI